MRALRAGQKALGFKQVQVDALPAQVHEALVKWANGKGLYVRDAAGMLIAEGRRQQGALSPEAATMTG